MVEMITQVNNAVNGVVWGPFGLALLFCTGFWMSARTGFFQFRKMGYWLRHTIGAIFTNKDITAHTSKEDMAISQFQSMCTALAGTIGTGNIVGVATAIVSGGPGAIFWMWVMALLGMMTSFSENVLGVYFRRKNEKGEWSGGAMYYLTDGLGAKKGCRQIGRVLAVLFACFCILASFGIGNMSQINSIAGNMNAAFGVPTLVTGLCLMVVTALIVIGGLKRVAAVTEKLVPADGTVLHCRRTYDRGAPRGQYPGSICRHLQGCLQPERRRRRCAGLRHQPDHHMGLQARCLLKRSRSRLRRHGQLGLQRQGAGASGHVGRV